MRLIERVIEIAKKDVKTIVLPESGDKRTIDATRQIVEQGIAKIILIGKEDVFEAHPQVTVINPENFDKLDEFANALAELRKSKGMTFEEAKKLLLTNELFMAVMLVKMGMADGMVAGAVNSTADVLRAALQVIKTAKGTKLVSAIFLMEVPNSPYGEEGCFVFGDSGLNPNPTAEELAHIAISSAKTFESVIQKEPKVAMLSFSTMGSAKHPDVDKVIEATRIAKELEPNLALDGELQLDAAIVPSVGKSKAPNSTVAGKANVLIFPDLGAGNIGYKLTQRLAGAEAYGPICQGLARPVNDLSRGCTAEDIVGVVAITALQAQLS